MTEKKISAAFDVYALTLALRQALEEIAKRVVAETGLEIVGTVEWSPINDEQGELIQYYRIIDDTEITTLEELKAWVRDTAEELNLILEEHGFSIRLEPWIPSPGNFGVVAIYDITIEWLIEGAVKDEDGEPYIYDGKPFFSLPRVVPQDEPPFVDLPQIQFFQMPGNQVVVKIPGKRTDDYLCLTMAREPMQQFELIAAANSYRSAIARMEPTYRYDEVQLPNMLYDSEEDGPIDISWLIGLQTLIEVDDPAQDENPIHQWLVSQAKMQAKFAMGPKGARAKVAVAIGLEKAVLMPPEKYVANHDLLVWMQRDGVNTAPFFALYIPKENFADHIVDLDEID